MKMKKIFTMALAAAMTMALSIPAWATPTPLQQASSTQNINDTDTIGQYGNTATDRTVASATNDATENCVVDCQVAGFFVVTIPKDITMAGTHKAAHADYTVNVKGDIAGDLRVTVTPDATFAMSEAGGKADITASNSYTAGDNIWDCDDLLVYGTGDAATTIVGSTRDFDIDAALTVGSWSGNFDFTIEYEAIPAP
jgi:hypothetical protein